jgi:Phage-integrase repeat unit
MREDMYNLGIKTGRRWNEYCKSGKKPQDIPSGPDDIYKKYWQGWGDWLGTGYVASYKRRYRSFEDAKQFVKSLGLRSERQWKAYSRSIEKPDDIPNSPAHVYKTEWKGIGDWLGTGYVALYKRSYRNFEEARRFVHSLGIRNREEWSEYCKSGRKPDDIPANPWQLYRNQWISMSDWLGYEEPTWSIRKIKRLLKDLIENGVIYTWSEAVLYSFLLRKGLLNLYYTNRHRVFFKNLIQAARTSQGRKEIVQYTFSDSSTPPNLQDFSAQTQNTETEIEIASIQDLAKLSESSEPLDYDKPISVEQVLTNTSVLESINVDEEAMQFYLNYSIDELWKLAFQSVLSFDYDYSGFQFRPINKIVKRQIESLQSAYRTTIALLSC